MTNPSKKNVSAGSVVMVRLAIPFFIVLAALVTVEAEALDDGQAHGQHKRLVRAEKRSVTAVTATPPERASTKAASSDSDSLEEEEDEEETESLPVPPVLTVPHDGYEATKEQISMWERTDVVKLGMKSVQDDVQNIETEKAFLYKDINYESKLNSELVALEKQLSEDTAGVAAGLVVLPRDKQELKQEKEVFLGSADDFLPGAHASASPFDNFEGFLDEGLEEAAVDGLGDSQPPGSAIHEGHHAQDGADLIRAAREHYEHLRSLDPRAAAAEAPHAQVQAEELSQQDAREQEHAELAEAEGARLVAQQLEENYGVSISSARHSGRNVAQHQQHHQHQSGSEGNPDVVHIQVDPTGTLH